MGITTSTPRKAPLKAYIRLAALPDVSQPEPQAEPPKPDRCAGKLLLPMLRIAVKKGDTIQYFIRVPDPREEIIAEFNAKNRPRGVHAVAMFEPGEELRTSFEVVVNGKLVFRSWEYPEAKAEYGRRKNQGGRVDFLRRRARVLDDMAVDMEGGEA